MTINILFGKPFGRKRTFLLVTLVLAFVPLQGLRAAQAEEKKAEAEESLRLRGFVKTLGPAELTPKLINFLDKAYPDFKQFLAFAAPMLNPLGYPNFDNVVSGEDFCVLYFEQDGALATMMAGLKLEPSVRSIFEKTIIDYGMAVTTQSPRPSAAPDSEIPWTFIAPTQAILDNMPPQELLDKVFTHSRQEDIELHVMVDDAAMTDARAKRLFESYIRPHVEDDAQLPRLKALTQLIVEEAKQVADMNFGLSFGEDDLRMNVRLSADPETELHRLWSQKTPSPAVAASYLTTQPQPAVYHFLTMDAQSTKRYWSRWFELMRQEPELKDLAQAPWAQDVLEYWNLSEFAFAAAIYVRQDQHDWSIVEGGRFDQALITKLFHAFYDDFWPYMKHSFELGTFERLMDARFESNVERYQQVQVDRVDLRVNLGEDKLEQREYYSAVHKGMHLQAEKKESLYGLIDRIEADQKPTENLSSWLQHEPSNLWDIHFNIKRYLSYLMDDVVFRTHKGIEARQVPSIKEKIEELDDRYLHARFGCEKGTLFFRHQFPYNQIPKIDEIVSMITWKKMMIEATDTNESEMQEVAPGIGFKANPN